jgi:transposase-like protein
MARRRTLPSRARGRETWKQIVDELGKSGLSVARYARRHGLSARTLAWWRWALWTQHRHAPRVPRRSRVRVQRAEPCLSFVPVNVVADAVRTPADAALQVVLARGRRIDVQGGFDGETLARLVQVLEATSC